MSSANSRCVTLIFILTVICMNRKTYILSILSIHMKHIQLNLTDQDFFKLIKCKHKIQDFSQKKITWEEFIMLMTITKEVKQSKW